MFLSKESSTVSRTACLEQNERNIWNRTLTAAIDVPALQHSDNGIYEATAQAAGFSEKGETLF